MTAPAILDSCRDTNHPANVGKSLPRFFPSGSPRRFAMMLPWHGGCNATAISSWSGHPAFGR